MLCRMAYLAPPPIQLELSMEKLSMKQRFQGLFTDITETVSNSEIRYSNSGKKITKKRLT